MTHCEVEVQHVLAMPAVRLQDVDLWLLDSLVVPASVHDVEGRFLHMNGAAAQRLGLLAAPALGPEPR